MNTIGSAALILCYLCVGVSMLLFIMPQKRTRHILNFALGLFLIVTLGNLLLTAFSIRSEALPEFESSDVPSYDEQEYVDTVAQITVDELVQLTDELLRNEGIIAKDIRLTLRITEEGRIFIGRADIYISELYADRKEDIKRVVYRNLSKEPDVYVQKEEYQ